MILLVYKSLPAVIWQICRVFVLNYKSKTFFIVPIISQKYFVVNFVILQILREDPN